MEKVRWMVLGMLAAGLLLAACEKEQQLEIAEKTPNEAIELITTPVGEKDTLAMLFATLLNNADFGQAVYRGAAEMLDGDNEFLLAEVATPARSRGESTRAWQQTISSYVRVASDGTRGNGRLPDVVERLLQSDPLTNFLLLAPDGEELDASDMDRDDLLVVALPANYDDQKDYQLRGYTKQGEMVMLSSRVAPNRPVLVVGRNERVICVPRGTNPGEGYKLYYQGRTNAYYFRNPPLQWHLPEDGDDDGGGYMPPVEPNPQPPKPVAPTPTDRSKLSGKSEYLLKAGFKSQRDLEEVEPWPKGRPEVRCYVAFHDGSKENMFLGDRGWWNGNTKDLNIQFWKWADEAKSGDYYTIKWIEEDGGAAVDLSLSYTYKGITGKVGFKWNDDDDTIGERSVHYTDEALRDGKLYDLGGFRFWIAVK